MIKRTVFTTLLAVIALAQACLAAGESPKTDRETTAFPEWGFSAEIPAKYERTILPAGGNVLSSQVFAGSDYVYVVKVLKVPPDTLASTHIEQLIQAEIKSAPAGTAKRWELDSRQGELFKGVTVPLSAEMATNTAISKMLNGRAGVISVAMAPLKDESSPVLSIGVVSVDSLRREAENTASAVATFLRFNRTSPVKPLHQVSKPPVVSSKPNPVPPVVTPVKPTAPKPVGPVAPKPMIAPKPHPAPRYTLRKGEIELSGTVSSMQDSKSMEMTVDTVRMPGQSPIKLGSPVAGKRVMLKKLPAGITVGSRVVVAGKNLGKGAPITAASIGLAVSE